MIVEIRAQSYEDEATFVRVSDVVRDAEISYGGLVADWRFQEQAPVVEAVGLEFFVPDDFDREALAEALSSEDEGRVVLDDYQASRERGPEFAMWEFVLHASTLVGGAAGVTYLVEKARQLLMGRDRELPKDGPDAGVAVRLAREFVARCHGTDSRTAFGETNAVQSKPISGGHRVRVNFRGRSYDVEVTDSYEYRMTTA